MADSAESRTVVELSPDERESLRRGMRAYLESVHAIVTSLAEHRISAVSGAAGRVGMGMVDDVPPSLAVKLPVDFVILSVDTHQRFDALALAASQGATKGDVVQHLRDILTNCTSCHAMYRLAPQ
jgi:hypothetical protein